jgi:SAM-dependent methyltransferase
MDWFIFFFLNRMISAAFRLSHLATLPVRAVFAIARPDSHQFDYEDLLAMRARYPAQARSAQTSDDRQRHQVKWAGRVTKIARIYGCKRILEVGCGHGLATTILQQAGFEVIANDVVNILDSAANQAGVKFIEGDICQGLNYQDATFDLVFSINSFEHFHNPAAALDEMLRLTRPGGLIYLTFDPLYYSPWGLHAIRRLGFPYPQILFPESTIQRFVDEKAAEIAETYDSTSDKTHISPPLNRWTVEQFRQIFSQKRDILKMIIYTERTALKDLGMVVAHAGLFKAYAPSFTSLIVSGINLLARKI